MGACMTHLEAECQPIPSRHCNGGNGLNPQRPEAPMSQKEKDYQYQEFKRRRELEKSRSLHGSNSGSGEKLERLETPSGIPGLTYDQAGRPVWREENAVHVEHREHS